MNLIVKHSGKLPIAVFCYWVSTQVTPASEPWIYYDVIGFFVLAAALVLPVAHGVKNDKGDLPVVLHFDFSFWVQWLFLLAGGWWSLSKVGVLGYWALSVLLLSSLGLLVTYLAVRWQRNEIDPGHALVSLCFVGYFLFHWELNSLKMHYGVPIIGHFLERDNYTARYMLKVQEMDEDYNERGPVWSVPALLEVKRGTETEDYGEEDRFGQSITRSYDTRDVWVRSVDVNGRTVPIWEQDEPLDSDGWGYVRLRHDLIWRVQLLKSPVF